MIPAMIIPASILGFVSAFVRYAIFNAGFYEAALTYLVVCAAVPAILLWIVKTVEIQQHEKPGLSISAQ